MKSVILKSALLTAAVSCTALSFANERAGMLVANNFESNPQEKAAYDFFMAQNADGVVIKAGETSKINANDLDFIWIHLDACGAEKGVLPAEIADEATLAALKTFVENGGNLYLSKQATQYLSKIGRTDAKFDPNIFGSGEGGEGTDVWTVNAQIGYMNAEADPSQFYDRRSHAIYKDLRTNSDFACETFALEGTGDGTAMRREDHNCCWDLNAYAYTAEGDNTVAKFEDDNNALVIGTWGHVVDYAVAGIVEFLPTETYKGTILANGLAACEWAPRNGGNNFHNNLEALTSNAFNYLSDNENSAVENITIESDEAPVYYNLQGIRVNAADRQPGIYVVRCGNKVSKTVVK